jgi:hypothetical protein
MQAVYISIQKQRVNCPNSYSPSQKKKAIQQFIVIYTIKFKYENYKIYIFWENKKDIINKN